MGADILAEQGLTPSGTEDESGTSAVYSTLAVAAALTGAGVAGRVALQHVPSVEPIIAVAAATGFYFGTRKGIMAGASGFYLSNFLVYGGQGPWTVFQVLGAAVAGVSGGIIGKVSEGRYAFLSSLFVGVLSYELFVNLGSLTFASFTGIGTAYLASAAPFILTHVASTIGFGLILYGSKEKIGLYRKN